MPFPTSDTIVSYPDGATTSTGTVVHVEELADGRAAVLLDATAVHPVDTAWPDQPADFGDLVNGDDVYPLADAVTGGINEGVLYLGRDLPVRGGTEGWIFVVAHIIDGPAPAVGAVVETRVDAERRTALSAGHTACHLASLALDAALADAWTKPVQKDALGNPGFDALAIETSRIHPNSSIDVYRIGKSLRRKGFTPAALDDLPAVQQRANDLLEQWRSAGGTIHIARDAPELSARRTWVCELSAGTTNIPCGGTHLHNLDELAAVTVVLELVDVDGARELTMTTTASRISGV
ncbi:metal-dependent hydrolase [Glaciihabitans arcticus]|uniref:Metal-dependent hydrolase n=1 Tax=Glaciihabitans arcticus TaxID=2668039 RepID=A0A4Q9GRM6_9MICO|nr:metal-dependent hydrolase [Glaciihabitans arcticus]TBN57612.1 metal-dependent hydrolase [Glaciihabitans arcticus]